MAERLGAGLSRAAAQATGEGDVRRFLAQTAILARRQTVVDPMAVPSAGALDAHLEARLDAEPVPGANGNPEGKAPVAQPQTRRGSPGKP